MNTLILSPLIQKVQLFARRRAVHRRQQDAVHQAWEAFGARHPGWVASLFDEHFLKNGGAPAANAVLDGGPANPARLAEAWAAQFSWGNRARRQAAVRRLVPAAAEYLHLVRRS